MDRRQAQRRTALPHTQAGSGEQARPLFDEQDPGVKKLIATVTEVAHAHGRKVGLCGQAPSDHPEFAKFLAEVGLDSVSVTADAFANVVTILGRR